MYPRLLTTDFFTLYTFGVLLAAAFLAALWWTVRAAKREGLDPGRVMSLGLWAIVGAIVGAKVLMVARNFPQYLAAPSELWSLSFLESAGDFYGGFLGALAACAVYFWRHPELPAWQAADVCAPAIALGQMIGRVGCFMAGDDYGRPTSLPWAVTFTDPEAARVGGAPLNVSLHPVQLYESAVCLLLFLILVWIARRKRFHGEVILAYGFLYAVARFVIEYFRGDADRGFVLGGTFSTSQSIAILVGAGALILFAVRYRAHRPPDSHIPPPIT